MIAQRLRPIGLVVAGPAAEAFGENTWLLVAASVMAGTTLLALVPGSVRNLRRVQEG